MVKNQTVLIIGAGASSEVNMPTGAKLKESISSLLDLWTDGAGKVETGDPLVFEAIKLKANRSTDPEINYGALMMASKQISGAMAQALSIDNYIDDLAGNKAIEISGKLSIVRSILQAEHDSLLFIDQTVANPGLNFQTLEDTWFGRFFQLITENARFEDLADRLTQFTLIVFNYDRCIEHFLLHAFQNYYKVDVPTAAKLVQSITIIHPYGAVGKLPWQEDSDSLSFEFGSEPTQFQLLDLAGQIRTFTEGTDPSSSEIKTIRRKILEANILAFLGFAFHRLNMALLKPTQSDGTSDQHVQIYATAHGLSDNDVQSLIYELQNFVAQPMQAPEVRNELKCSGMFREYWRDISISQLS